MKWLPQFLFYLMVSFALSAQTNPVCEDNDCSPDIFSVQLEAPMAPAKAGDVQRTQQFKGAYQKVKQIKSQMQQDPTWKTRYQSNALNGKSCLRLNQLESYFAYEYELNPEFKKFIDRQESNAEAWKEEGFQSSRRAINLSTRMKDHCPNEVKKVEKAPAGSLDELPKKYMKLGHALGYFDEKGNQLKPLDDPSTAAQSDPEDDLDNMNKKQQIAELKDRVNQLPLGPETKDKIDGVKNALQNAKPNLGLLQGALGGLNAKLGTFLPEPTGLLSKINAARDILGALKNLKLKLPFKGLFNKIGDLFKEGEDLGKKAKDLVDNSNKLKDRYDDLAKKANDLEDKIKDRTSAVDGLEKQLDNLEQKQKELQEKLEDRPRKILDELKQQVGEVSNEAGDLVDQVQQENDLKDQLLDELKKLTNAKDKITDELANLEDKAADLAKEQQELDRETKAVQKEAEEAKKLDEKVDDLNKALEDLKPEKELEAEIADCEEDLKKLLLKISGLDEKQGKVKKKLGGLLDLPGKLLGKLSDLNLFQNKLKLPKDGVPVAEKTIAKVDKLIGKANAIGSFVEGLTGKKTKLQEKVENIGQKVDQVKGLYDSKLSNLDQLKGELVQLVAEKSGLKDLMDQAGSNTNSLDEKVRDFIDRYNLFDEKSDCLSKEELEQKIKDILKEQEQAEPELEELEGDLNDAEQQEEKLEQETQEVADEIDEQAEQAEELKQEEAAIKEEYGTDVELEPVTVEEWAESFEVDRPYWDAVFHPDDEVVEGYKGRYFEVRLKDADKAVKLLFGPGEYFMSKSDFRKNYGPTIGAFVTEALHTLKKTDRDKIKVFIQGSADIVGQSTFSGNLDKSYYYEEITVLPQSGEERFAGTAVSKKVPITNFRNNDLPNLRGCYLKEMISVYSKKLDPILLEGSVKEVVSERDRNAIIYLFIPEELLEAYGN